MKILISVKTQIIIFTLTLSIIVLIALIGCSNRLSIAERELDELKIEIAQLEEETGKQNEELSKYDTLTGNLNKLLKTVYYGSAVSETEGKGKSFTAFSMFYKGDFYIITAGHCIEYEGIKYTDFKFKSNTESFWKYPKLLYYKADYMNNSDFGIFTLPHLRTGLMIDEKDTKPKYVLGNFERKLNFFKEFKDAKEGESGSPILSSGCKLVGIVIKNNTDYTPISEVTQAIDSMLTEQAND
jgi:hypothetical protein